MYSDDVMNKLSPRESEYFKKLAKLLLKYEMAFGGPSSFLEFHQSKVHFSIVEAAPCAFVMLKCRCATGMDEAHFSEVISPEKAEVLLKGIGIDACFSLKRELADQPDNRKAECSLHHHPLAKYRGQKKS